MNGYGILHETENMYLNDRMEVCLNGITHAVVIGKSRNLEHGKAAMAKLEKYPLYLRHMYQHGGKPSAKAYRP